MLSKLKLFVIPRMVSTKWKSKIIYLIKEVISKVLKRKTFLKNNQKNKTKFLNGLKI